MKKIYAAVLFSMMVLGAYAQCTPDNNLTQPGYYPEQLDTAPVGLPYGMVLQLRVPPDTNVVFFGQPINADIDSIKLVSVEGMPTGFTYACNVASCTFTPTQTYCAKLSGNPTANQAGTYPLKLAVLAYAHGVIFGTPTNFPPQPDTIRRFTLVVGSGTNAIIENTKAYGLTIYPNPARTQATIRAQDNEKLTYTLSDITGKTHQSGTLQSGEATLPLHSLAKGIYFVQVQGALGTATTRLVVE